MLKHSLRRMALVASVAAWMAVPASAQAIEPNPSPGPVLGAGKVSIAPLPSPMPRPDAASTIGPQAGKVGHLSPEALGIIVVCRPLPR